jgi:hypothetical protein
MLGMAAYFNNQTQALRGLQAAQARDNLIMAIARFAADPAALTASAGFGGVGNWPTNTAAGGFRDCWQGGGNCVAATEVGFTLLNSQGNRQVAGPGQAANPRYDGTTAVYSNDGNICGNSVDVNPDSKKCPIVAYTTFTPVCPAGYCGASAAQSLVIRFYLRQGNTAHPVTLAAGRLRPYTESVTVLTSAVDTQYPISACPGGMTTMAAGTRAQYCISTAAEAEGAQTLAAARTTCMAKGAGFSLCSFLEWSMACNAGTFAPAEQWISDATGGGQWGAVGAIGGANCVRAGRLDLTGAPTRAFRCCVR